MTNNHATRKLNCASSILLVAGCIALLASAALAQQAAPAPTTTKPLTFHVATIKPTATTDFWRRYPHPTATPPPMSLSSNSSAKPTASSTRSSYPRPALDRPRQVRPRSQILRRLRPCPQNLTHAQRAAMLQPLLADRFHLSSIMRPKPSPSSTSSPPKAAQTCSPTPGAPADDMISSTCQYTRGPGYAQAPLSP